MDREHFKLLEIGDYVKKDDEYVRVESINRRNGDVFTSDGGVMGREEIDWNEIKLESEL